MVAPARFRTVRRFLGPSWLTEEEGELIGYSLDTIRDLFIERTRQSLMLRFPQQGPNGETADPEVLALLGRDRRMVRGLFETDAEYAARLKLWLDDRRRAGNPYMLMQKLAEYLGPLPSYRTVDARGNWFARAADGTQTRSLKQENWDWSGEPVGERWARAWVIIYPNGLWSAEGDWGDVGDTWGDDGETWGTTAPSEHVQTVRAIVADWGLPAGMRCINIIIALDAMSFDPTAPEPDGTWEHWSMNTAGTQAATRLDTARYWDGVTR
jgi:hypothetical protein